MLHLLESWNVGGLLRRPWCVLEAAKCPIADTGFVRWSRAQILRLNSAEGRRWETRFANWPYPLHALQSEKYTEDAKQGVRDRLLAADRRELDTYALGIRTLFPAATALKSQECESVLHTDFRCHGLGIDFVECLNSQLTLGSTARAPGRSIATGAREFLIKQACDVHVARGGQHPLGGDLAIGTQEEVVVQMPLLRGEVGAAIATPDQGAHEVADERVGEPRRPPSLEAGLASAIDAGALPSRELALAEEVPFDEPVSLVRGRSRIGLGAGSSGGDGPRKKQGLNPRMMAKNQYLHDAKTAAGRNMTEAELQEHAAMFQRLWENIVDTDSYQEAYEDWQISSSSATAPPRKYLPSFGGGVAARLCQRRRCMRSSRARDGPRRTRSMMWICLTRAFFLI